MQRFIKMQLMHHLGTIAIIIVFANEESVLFLECNSEKFIKHVKLVLVGQQAIVSDD